MAHGTFASDPPVSSTIRVGVIGLGFMGQTHIRAYGAAAAAGHACVLGAVCDPDSTRLSGFPPRVGNLGSGGASERLFDPAVVRTCTDPAQLLGDRSIDLVSICTYTDSHVDLAIRALNAGKHVLVEKPIALRAADARRLRDAAADSTRICMPAMCMRFWPGWDWLRDRIRDNSFGAVRSAVFQRLGAGPNWGGGFYRDFSRSGGALFDLHVHDADFLYWCFGAPSFTLSSGTPEHLTCLYRYAAGPRHVTAEGAWDLSPAAGFRMRYLVTFEHATAEFDLAREHRLMLHRADSSEPVPLSPLTGYDYEVRHVLDAVVNGSTTLRATLDDAVAVTEILEEEARGLDR